jgi:hypothetical protein
MRTWAKFPSTTFHKRREKRIEKAISLPDGNFYADLHII